MEEKNLSYVLSKSADQEAVLYLEELHGLLFGLAIAPEPITPTEWLSIIFDEEPHFDDAQDAKICIDHLFNAYNRMVGDNNNGKLTFPFNMNKLNKYEYSLIEDWTYGLFLALSLKPDIWGITEEYEEMNEDDLPEDIADIMDSFSIITAIALPDEREEIIKTVPGQPSKDPEEIEAALYDMLPLVIKVLQDYSANLRKENTSRADGLAIPADSLKQKKPGPNDPCPCGSGRTYSRCCGSN
ncbi:MAG: UPF0149 family protein [Deltaproteobacteria bacterium]|nr:UPF0149 family protein [Deltaproteobacteria bacterium]